MDNHPHTSARFARTQPPLTYYFLDTPLCAALAAFRQSTGTLVYTALGNDRSKLRKVMTQNFAQLARKTGVAYPLRHGEAADAPPRIQASLDTMEALLSGTHSSTLVDTAPDIPVEYLFGTAFQRRVWDALVSIPRGETRTYGQLAAEVSSPRAARAVGQACNRNQIALVVPCHRVVGSDGGLVSFRWGVSLKQQLLRGEAGVGTTPLRGKLGKHTASSLQTAH